LKNILFLIFILIACLNSYGDDKEKHKLHIELNLLHYGKAYGVFLPSFYNNKISYLKEVELGFWSSQSSNVYVGFKRYDFNTEISGFLYNGDSSISGFEINAGFIRNFSDKEYGFSLGIGTELFITKTEHKGYYIVNEPDITIQNNNITLGPTNFNVINNYYEYFVNHSLIYSGPAVKVKAYFTISKHFDIVYDFRFRLGLVFVNGLDIPEVDYKPNFMLMFEPINVLGVRYKL